MSFLADRSVYEDRYDTITVDLCRWREQLVLDALGERPALDARGEADSASGYYQYSILYFEFVELVAGDRWQRREDTITEWMAADEAKDRRLAEARPAKIPYCRSCGEDMEIATKHYHHRERSGKEQDDILFMFDCKRCHKRVASWQDGTEWKPDPARCEQCGAGVAEKDTRRGTVITTTYICGQCGHSHKSTLRLGTHSKPKPDPLFTLDRRRFCFDAATGKRFLARKTHIEHLRGVLERAQQEASGEQTFDPVATAAESIKRLKVAQVADLLATATTEAGYTEFKLGELEAGRELAAPFNCLDARAERSDYDSPTELKKLITATLADTNWQLMSDGIHHRLGYLSGRLRAHESEDDLRKLVERRVKAKTLTLPTAPQPRPTKSPVADEATPAPKRPSRRKQRAIRVRGILHKDLHILIPPREGPSVRKPAARPRKTSRQ